MSTTITCANRILRHSVQRDQRVSDQRPVPAGRLRLDREQHVRVPLSFRMVRHRLFPVQPVRDESVFEQRNVRQSRVNGLPCVQSDVIYIA